MSEDILVLSAAYTTDRERWRVFRESCARHKVPVEILGVGESYPDIESIPRGIEFLKSRQERHVVLTDAYDVLVNRWDAREISVIVDSAPHLVVSVEPLVWPSGPWEQAYRHLEGRYKWLGINGGQQCGRRGQTIEVLQTLYDRMKAGDSTAGGTTQELLHRMYMEGAPFTLDLECRIFQSMLGEAAGFIREDWDCAFNTVTKSKPMFLHFNGQGKNLKAMYEWERRLQV